ncbi:MAG: MFS transporter, partial [Anaerolineae bacterium]|nr:MFS transporter [Anaerolineae bacterium]
MKLRTTLRRMALLTPVLLLIELLDEFVFGAREAALPLIRDELDLSYQQIGLLLTVPIVIASVIEPLMFMLADVWKRKWLVLGGALLYGTELLVLAVTHDFMILLVSMIILFPASGALVGLAQAALIDSDPKRQEQQMARWTLAGSVGVVGGPLA